MAVYDLDRFSILVVEDNAYIRSILARLLRSMQVGNVLEAVSGADAVEMLKVEPGKDMGRDVGPPHVDIILSDLVMSPLNGLLLLRWIRTAKESPNRFIPFVMLSGAADADYVNAARDLGVTEFLAKPFSVQSIYKRLLRVIDYPRQFVLTKAYFGPDRRRRKGEPPDMERRILTDEDITVVYSTDKVVEPKDATDVWNFRLPNRLQDLAGGVGATGPGELPDDLLARAEEELDRASMDFTDWAVDYLKELSALCDRALRQKSGRRRQLEEINLLAHELRGQGGTFGYPLVTLIAKMLFDATGPGCPEDDDAIEVAKAHIDALRAVIRDKVAGDGGEVGKELMASLQAAIDRRSERRESR